MNTDIGAILSGVAAIVLAAVQVYKLIKGRNGKKPPTQAQPEPPPRHKKLANLKYSPLLLLSVVLACTAIALVIIPRVNPLGIGLTYPQDGSYISQETTVKGYATKELSPDQHLYVVVEHGGLWWPQCSETTMGYSHPNQRWEFSTPARIGKVDDVGKGFTIRVILVDLPIHQYFQSWFEENVDTEEWLGIPILEVNQWGKVQIYATITVTRQ